MCGIVGAVFNWESGLENLMPEALSALNHRGPDDRGYEVFKSGRKRVALGHTRLSIIDLSAAAHQPMSSSNGRFSIVFNGEIYNYKELRAELQELGYNFSSSSDTEVLLASWSEWGEECLTKLVGMFSFVIYDKNSFKLFGVRDPFGVKPFFYHYKNQELIFSSEVAPLLELIGCAPRLNLQRAYDYLVYGDYDSVEESFFEGVYHLPPGHLIEFDVNAGKLEKSRPWWEPSIEERNSWSFEDAVTKVREKFLKNIQLHMRSDVPLGAALSGGIDSSAVVCAMRYLEPNIKIHTFSYIAEDKNLNEEYWVDRVNDHVDAIPHKVTVEVSELINDLDDMIVAQGEPFGSTSIYAQYRVFKEAKIVGTLVTLDGQGADEMLAGYNGYPETRLRSLLEQGSIYSAFSFLSNWSKWPGRSRSQAIRKLIGEYTSSKLYPLMRWLGGTGSMPVWVEKEFLSRKGIRLSPPRPAPNEGVRGRRLVAKLAQSLTSSGLRSLLRHGDRNSMRFSVESRVPFLTTGMVNLLLSMPEDYLVSEKGQTKYVFREAMRGIVPDDVLERRDKIGFATPEKDLVFSAPDLFRGWLEQKNDIPFINQQEVLKEFDDVMMGRKTFSSQLWRWINFFRWYQLFFVNKVR